MSEDCLAREHSFQSSSYRNAHRNNKAELSIWDAILDRVKHGPLDWNDYDPAEDPEGEAIAKEYIKQESEYARGWMWELSQDKPRKTV